MFQALAMRRCKETSAGFQGRVSGSQRIFKRVSGLSRGFRDISGGLMRIQKSLRSVSGDFREP